MTWKPTYLTESLGLPTESQAAFFREAKSYLDKKLEKIGLFVREVNHVDFEQLMSFARKYYSGHSQLSASRMYHLISFGSSLLLLDQDNQIRGYIMEATYARHNVSHGSSMAIDPTLAGNSLGRYLFLYSSIVAMHHGARLKKAMASPDNYASLVSMVNGCGGIIVDYEQDLFGNGPKLIINLLLEPEVLNRTPIRFEEGFEHYMTFELIPLGDLEKIEFVLKKERKVIIGLSSEHFIAMERTGIPDKYLLNNREING